MEINSQQYIIVIICTALLIILIYYIYNKYRVYKVNKKYKQRIQEVLEHRNNKLDRFIQDYKQQVPEQIQNKILEYSANELLEQLRQRKITSEQIVITYGIRIAQQGRELNGISDVDLQQALQEAKQRDWERLTKQQDELGPLHGLPITVKDHICVKGLRDTFGVAYNLFKPIIDSDSLLIQVLRSKGIIPLAKSNIPVCCGGFESSNNIYGTSQNPWDLTRSPGGSTGGEATLISSRCSILGIGSDAAGSLRVPAAFTGIYSFMSSPTRSSHYGCFFGNDRVYRFGMRLIGSALGPLARNTDDLKLILENIYGELSKVDYYVNGMQFNHNIYNDIVNGKKLLKIGFIKSDKFNEAAPAIQNVISEVADKLKSKGHSVTEFGINDFSEYLYYFLQMIFTNGTAGSLIQALHDEYPNSSISNSINIHSIPDTFKKLFKFILSFTNSKRLHKIIDASLYKSTAQYSEYATQKELLKELFNQEVRKQQFDVILLPAAACVATKVGFTNKVFPLLNYSALINFLEYCSGCIPIRKIKQNEQFYHSKWNDKAAEALHEIMKNSEGLPINIQVAAPPMKEELCLAAMKLIENEFQFHELK